MQYKFRGNRIDNGELVCGNLIKTDGRCFIIPFITNGSWSQDRLMLKFISPCYGVYPDSVGMWTGLCDKNGVEVYEWDIYHHGDKNIKYVVEWHDTGFMGKQMGASSWAGLIYFKDEIEVIGNIHEGVKE